MSFVQPPSIKHLGYVGFMRFVHPLIKRRMGLMRQDYEVWATLREPISWLGSWYRYRSRPDVDDGNSTADMSFDEFVTAYCSKPVSPPAKVGNQLRMVCDPHRIGVDRLFPYNCLDNMVDLLSQKLARPLELGEKNVSAPQNTELSADTEKLLRKQLAHVFRLYDSLPPHGLITEDHQRIVEAD